jgi:cellulose synthase/poly-beta-1,6-N-acetylglucosamine synthase-like glycosyltransferase
MRAVRRLLSAAVACLSLAGLPYAVFLGLYALLRPDGSPVDKDRRRGGAGDGEEGRYEPTVSVVIPTYNEADIIRSRLENLLELDYPVGKLEVVIADASEDDTVPVARDTLDRPDAPPLVVREVDRRGVAPAVNAGVAAATGEVVFRTDADSLVAPDAVREAVATLADPSVGAVTGRQTEVLGEAAAEEDYRDLLATVQTLESHLDSTFIAHGPCFAFRRALFTPIPEGTIADDTAIGVAIRRGGDRVVMDPTIRFSESGASAFSARRQRKDRRAMGLLQLLVRNRDALGRYGAYGGLVLPFNWGFMITSPWLLAGAVVTTTLALAVVAPPLGLAVPLGLVGVFALGGREALGPLQPAYAVLDAQASLLVAAVRLATAEETGVWDLDRESRATFERESPGGSGRDSHDPDREGRDDGDDRADGSGGADGDSRDSAGPGG